MIVIDSSLPYPDYVHVLDSEKYKVAKENYDWFKRDPEGYRTAKAPKSKDLEKSLVKAIEDILSKELQNFKDVSRTCIDLYAYVEILNKVFEVGVNVKRLGIDVAVDDLTKQFIELTLKQTQHINELLSGELPDFAEHLPAFLNVINVLLTRTNASTTELVSACNELSTYSSKHLNTKSDCAGDSSFPSDIKGISGAMSAVPASSGAKNGGKLKAYPELTWLLSYRFKVLDRCWTVKDFLRNSVEADLLEHGCEANSVIVELSKALAAQTVNNYISNTTQLKFIQLSPNHCTSFESLLVVPSTSYLEVIYEIMRVSHKMVSKLNAEETELDSTETKKSLAYHGAGYVRVDVSSGKPQNVSALYQELYEAKGLPRFNNILHAPNISPEFNKLYMIDNWFKSRALSSKTDAFLNSKISNMENLLPVLPNRAKNSIKESTVIMVAKALLSHMNTHLTPLKSIEVINHIRKDGHKMESSMGLLKLITGESLTSGEAVALAECLADKLLNCPKSMRSDITETLTEYLL